MKGKQPKLKASVEPRLAEVVDLMERLRQSLQRAGKGSRKSAGTRKMAARGKKRRAA